MDRIAIIYDASFRPETTGIYCRRALSQLALEGQILEVQHFTPTELAAAAREHFALYLYVDDGLAYPLSESNRPSAFWAIDTHVSFERCLAKAQSADWVFAAQRDGAERLRAAGIANAQWLPLACDPELHGRRPSKKQFDISFVGNLFPGPRQELIDLLRKNFPRMFVGQRYFEKMAEIYSQSRIVFNRSIQNDVNMRVVEAMCSGSMLLTNDLRENGQTELFEDGVDLATYSDSEEMLDKVRFFLEHADLREQIAANGRAEVIAKHTYRHRMQTILSIAASASPSPRPCGERDGVRGFSFASTKGYDSHNPSRVEDQRVAGTGALREVPVLTSIAGSRASTTGGVGFQPAKSLPANANPTATAATRPTMAGKDQTYFEHDRPDVLELVPIAAQRILDVGCGSGRLGAAIKARQNAEVSGIELDRNAAEQARARLDHVHVGDIESDEFHLPEAPFDCIICADSLEHLRSPGVALKKLRDWLAQGGCLVTSVPNVRNHTVVRTLLAGNWTYETAGLLDADHVRFLTRRELEKLLYRAGFAVEEMRMVPGEGFEDWIKQGRPLDVAVGGLQVRATSQADASEFFAYQFLTRSVVKESPRHGLTSIIIVTHNAWNFTKSCVDSVRLRTDEPYELIFVDNGSTDGTLEYLQSLDGATGPKKGV